MIIHTNLDRYLYFPVKSIRNLIYLKSYWWISVPVFLQYNITHSYQVMTLRTINYSNDCNGNDVTILKLVALKVTCHRYPSRNIQL